MLKEEKCLICDSNSKNIGYVEENNSDEIHCSTCGKYYRAYGFETDLELANDKSKFYKISSWIREQNDDLNITPKIDKEKLEYVLNIREKTIKEKFDLMLLYLKTLPENIELKDSKSYKENMSFMGGDIDENIVQYCNDILTKCWIKDYNELMKLGQKAIDNNFFEGEANQLLKELEFNNLTFDGLQYIESLEKPNKSSKNIFVAFNFEKGLSKIFTTHVKEAIEKLGFNYTIVTQDTTTHDKAISDEIIAKLKSSRIVIADFTNHRNSVYFEAGFAMGMKIPIIWTCQEGHEGELSFDTRQYPHLLWKDGEDLAKQVSDRIQVII